MSIRIIDRYICRLLTEQIAMTATWLLAVSLFLALLELLQKSSDESNIAYVSSLMVLSIPTMIYEVAPMIFLIGTMLALAGISRELGFLAMQAGGISKYRITGTVISYSVIFSVVMFAWGEFVIPISESTKSRISSERPADSAQAISDYGMWVRDGNEFIFIERVFGQDKVAGIHIYRFNEQRELEKYTKASTATIWEESGSIQLNEVTESKLVDYRIIRIPHQQMNYQFAVDFRLLGARERDPFQLQIQDLYAVIEFLQTNNLDTEILELAFWNRIVIPISLIVMGIAAVVFTFRRQRRLNNAHFALIGLLFGLFYFGMQQSAGYIVMLTGMIPVVGTFGTLVFFFLGAVWALRRI